MSDDCCGEIFEAIGEAVGDAVGGTRPGPFRWLALLLLVTALGALAYYHETEHARPQVAPRAAALRV